jgi:hypothetical protein
VPASNATIEPRKFLLALVADLAQDKNFRACFKAAHRELHLFFWKLKQAADYMPFVEDLLFDANGNFPHCEQLDELLQEFQLSGVLSRPNPTYKFNDICITNSPSGDEFKRSLSDRQRQMYLSILDMFKHELGVPAPK